MAARATGPWFHLDIPQGTAAENELASAQALVSTSADALQANTDALVWVERSSSDFCGCCAWTRPRPATAAGGGGPRGGGRAWSGEDGDGFEWWYGGGPVPRRDNRALVTLGCCLFFWALVAMLMLLLLVWSVQPEQAVVVVDPGSGADDAGASAAMQAIATAAGANTTARWDATLRTIEQGSEIGSG